eukprot:CAMPEP_0168241018 /NCGR_PEP_ID=MMETSP0140_2-20121125/22555_1 /TAXON_ID=44445 /ORGANISM="Pseudo-nitzschia australis, Strain 10249 10 AB" /LENGTH=232 /DNA_ID=CAMNT_0008175809 /DNA_START=36 /DNA_END=734 /DNA_ORIENTATION=+
MAVPAAGSGTAETKSTSGAVRVQLPLKPPKTFQVSLLDAIAKLKTSQLENTESSRPNIALRMKTPPRPNGNNEIGPFVIKSHHSDLKIITEMIEHYGKAPFHIPIHLFTSSRDDDHDVSDFSEFSDISLYQQKLPNLYNCSLCEIDNYAPIFGLTPEDLRLLKEYMSNFEILEAVLRFAAIQVQPLQIARVQRDAVARRPAGHTQDLPVLRAAHPTGTGKNPAIAPGSRKKL